VRRRSPGEPRWPRVGALALDGWDTHNNEGAVGGRLSQLLALSMALSRRVEKNMGGAWNETVVALITEFGRTARINGTQGTDHGTGTVALLVGGALKGGRVIADWPGVKDSDLFENRDLKATTTCAPCSGTAARSLRVEDQALGESFSPTARVLHRSKGSCLRVVALSRLIDRLTPEGSNTDRPPARTADRSALACARRGYPAHRWATPGR